jgi:hypothetical protein
MGHRFCLLFRNVESLVLRVRKEQNERTWVLEVEVLVEGVEGVDHQGQV